MGLLQLSTGGCKMSVSIVFVFVLILIALAAGGAQRRLIPTEGEKVEPWTLELTSGYNAGNKVSQPRKRRYDGRMKSRRDRRAGLTAYRRAFAEN
mgnify:CR=1 FL=1